MTNRRHLSALFLLAGSAFLAWIPSGRAAAPQASTPLDSARAELAVGRAWHATRILREVGVDEGSPEEVLLLARAESGWKNHDAVRTLLEGVEWLDRVDGGAGWALLAAAHEHAERWQAAAAAYAAYLVTPAGKADPRGASLLARRARALAGAGALPEAMAVMASLSRDDGDVVSWLALELARDAAEVGDTTAVTGLLGRISDPGATETGWRVVADARLAAGDTAGTIAAFRAARARREPGPRHALAGIEVGLLLLARGDTTGARGLLRASLDDAPRATAARAARALLEVDAPDLDQSLRLAALLDRAGDGGGALRAYDRAWRQARSGEGELTEWQRLARARLLSTVPSRRDEALFVFRALHEETEDPVLGARTLEIWAGMRARQGLDGHVSTLRRWLLEEYPASPEAAEVFWDRGWASEVRGRTDEALRWYRALSEGPRTHALAGRARMRSGQIHVGRGEPGAAVRVFRTYLEDFPTGRRWEEASYWAAWSLIQLGDTTAAREQVAPVRADAPFSYYSVMAADLLGEPYAVALPPGEPPVEPGWLTRGLDRLDVLTGARLDEAAEVEMERLVARAEGSAQVTLRLAEALIERGRTIAGINLGWRLLADGHPWDRRLVQVLYPFPYREMVRREAEEWGVDPIMLAALIRQESAFEAEIVSHAGAIGLMQVMPPTGRELARAHGPRGFEEAALTTPEVNLHLGSAFFVEMSARYDDELPLVLSAYNAGPTRATRWRRYPEAADWLRFTERIPFDETRGYVKNVRRNLGVYRVLYGSGS